MERDTMVGRERRAGAYRLEPRRGLPGFVAGGLGLAVLGALLRTGATVQQWIAGLDASAWLQGGHAAQVDIMRAAQASQRFAFGLSSLGHVLLAVGLLVLAMGFLGRAFDREERGGTERAVFALTGVICLVASLLPGLGK